MAIGAQVAGRSTRSRARPWLQTLIGPALILATFWAARHAYHASFGFYEDDYTLVVGAMDSTWAEVREFAFDLRSRFAGQGRPLQHGLVVLLAYLAGRLGGLVPAYWLAYSVLAANALLYFLLLRRLGSPGFALVGGLAYALFSADTTQAFLYHAFGLQPSLTFLILATLAYLRRRPILGYALGLASLSTYETAYLVFLGVPLLEQPWDSRWRRRAFGHAAVVLAMLAGITLLRALAGEDRVLDVAPTAAVQTSLVHTLEGPAVALGSYILRPIQALQAVDRELAVASVTAFVAVAASLAFVSGGETSEVERRPFHLRRLLAGLALTGLAYPLTFTIRAYAISGRDSRVHLAAAFGAALVFGCAWQLVAGAVRRPNVRRAFRAAVSGLLALLVGFGIVVQKDYARAWELQQRFWTSLLEVVPDLEEGTVALVDPAGLADTRYIDANTWNLPVILPLLFEFPADWSRVPAVHRLIPDWRERSLTNTSEIKAVDYRYEYVVVPWANTVVVETAAETVSNRLSSVVLMGVRYPLKELSTSAPITRSTGVLPTALISGP